MVFSKVRKFEIPFWINPAGGQIQATIIEPCVINVDG
jgi:hypothetical protein